jgi:hypothetical protein
MLFKKHRYAGQLSMAVTTWFAAHWITTIVEYESCYLVIVVQGCKM